MAAQRTAVLVYYLDDSAASKQFAPIVSELQRVWSNRIDLIPLVTDPLQSPPDQDPSDPSHYWKGMVPQVVVLDGDGSVKLDASGQVDLDSINLAITEATGFSPEGLQTNQQFRSFNELNTEVISTP